MQDSKWEDYYQILGVDLEDGPEEIRRAYRALAMEYHPDRQAGATEGVRRLAEEKLKQINQAYQILSNPQKRLQYHQEWVRWKSPPKPLVDPANLLFRNVAPGDVRTASFTIRNQGGPYERLWISNPDSWVRVTGYASLSDTDELPLRVEVEAEGQEWEKSYTETITVRLNAIETTVTVGLSTKPAPASDSWVPPRPGPGGVGAGVSSGGAGYTSGATSAGTTWVPPAPTGTQKFPAWAKWAGGLAFLTVVFIASALAFWGVPGMGDSTSSISSEKKARLLTWAESEIHEPSPALATSPAVSPDGAQTAVVEFSKGVRIVVRNSETLQVQSYKLPMVGRDNDFITPEGARVGPYVFWSPDGRRLAYRVPEGVYSRPSGPVGVIDTDNGQQFFSTVGRPTRPGHGRFLGPLTLAA